MAYRTRTKGTYTKDCVQCGNSFETYMPTTKTCSLNCRLIYNRTRYNRTSDDELPTGTVGAMSELMIGADLLRRGYAVFRALSPSCYCDLIAVKDGVSKAVEVRTGYIYSQTGNLSFSRKIGGQVDIFAVVDRKTGSIHYLDPKDWTPINIP